MNMQISKSFKSGIPIAGFNPKTAVAVLAAVSCFFFSGCASFSDKMIRQQKVKLREENLNLLAGTYQLFPDLAYTKNGGAEMLRYTGKTERFHQYVGKNKMESDPSANNTVTVKVFGNNRISFVFRKDSTIVDSVTLSAKLQSRGLLLIGNKYVKYWGVPYLFGVTESAKTRIGLANDNGLILNHAYDNSGAILIIMAAGRSSSLAYHFKRISAE
ncbi:hypothetical protein [Pedobacter sp.]|uniref:hypothetical protein n=1 Tax=Pedobacter sp. TaxID=1411316 RepID=UPI0031DED1AE